MAPPCAIPQFLPSGLIDVLSHEASFESPKPRRSGAFPHFSAKWGTYPPAASDRPRHQHPELLAQRGATGFSGRGLTTDPGMKHIRERRVVSPRYQGPVFSLSGPRPAPGNREPAIDAIGPAVELGFQPSWAALADGGAPPATARLREGEGTGRGPRAYVHMAENVHHRPPGDRPAVWFDIAVGTGGSMQRRAHMVSNNVSQQAFRGRGEESHWGHRVRAGWHTNDNRPGPGIGQAHTPMSSFPTGICNSEGVGALPGLSYPHTPPACSPYAKRHT